MPIKYGRCANPNCVLRGKTQDAEDCSFVCKACKAELSDSSVPLGGPPRGGAPVWVARSMLALALIAEGGYYLFLDGPPTAVPLSAGPPTEAGPASPPPENTGKKSLEEWLDEYPVDR